MRSSFYIFIFFISLLIIRPAVAGRELVWVYEQFAQARNNGNCQEMEKLLNTIETIEGKSSSTHRYRDYYYRCLRNRGIVPQSTESSQGESQLVSPKKTENQASQAVQ